VGAAKIRRSVVFVARWLITLNKPGYIILMQPMLSFHSIESLIIGFSLDG